MILLILLILILLMMILLMMILLILILVMMILLMRIATVDSTVWKQLQGSKIHAHCSDMVSVVLLLAVGMMLMLINTVVFGDGCVNYSF